MKINSAKKLLRFLVFVIAAISSVQANYFITWANNQAAFYVDGDTSNPIAPMIGDTIRFELWYAGPDGAIDNNVVSEGVTDGDDVLLSYGTFQNVTNTQQEQYGIGFQQSFGGGGTEPFLGPEVYMRVYDAEFVTLGARYLTSSVFMVNEKDFSGPSPTSDVIQFPASFIEAQFAVIPEPGTMMLVLVGFATAVISVKRRRNRIN